MAFLAVKRAELLAESPEMKAKEVMTAGGTAWRGLSEKKKAKWAKKAEDGKAKFAAEWQVAFLRLRLGHHVC